VDTANFGANFIDNYLMREVVCLSTNILLVIDCRSTSLFVFFSSRSA
jgi:hypothetical protein